MNPLFNIIALMIDTLYVFLCNKICIISFIFRNIVAFTMDQTIWKFFPFYIIELIFHWLPLALLMRFKLVCKQWSVLLQNPIFLVSYNLCSDKEFGIISLWVCMVNNWFFGSYLSVNNRYLPCSFNFFILDTKLNVQWDQQFCSVRLEVICVQIIISLWTLLQRNL